MQSFYKQKLDMRADLFLAAPGLGFGIEGLVREDWEIGNIKKRYLSQLRYSLIVRVQGL